MHPLVFVAVAAVHGYASRPPPSLDQDLINSLPFKANWSTNTRVIELPCLDCRVGPSQPLRDLPLDHESRPGETFPESVLRLNVSVAENSVDDNLMLNNCSFYPRPGQCTTLWVDQFVKSSCRTWDYKASPETAFSMRWDHLDDDLLGRGIKLNVLHLSIGRVATKLVSPEPEIEVKALIWPNGQILIATDPVRAPTKKPSFNPQCPGHQHHHHSHHWYCRALKFLKAIIRHVLSSFVLGLTVAAIAFYIWRRRLLRHQESMNFHVLQNIINESHYSDKTESFSDHIATPKLYRDVTVTDPTSKLRRDGSL